MMESLDEDQGHQVDAEKYLADARKFTSLKNETESSGDKDMALALMYLAAHSSHEANLAQRKSMKTVRSHDSNIEEDTLLLGGDTDRLEFVKHRKRISSLKSIPSATTPSVAGIASDLRTLEARLEDIGLNSTNSRNRDKVQYSSSTSFTHTSKEHNEKREGNYGRLQPESRQTDQNGTQLYQTWTTIVDSIKTSIGSTPATPSSDHRNYEQHLYAPYSMAGAARSIPKQYHSSKTTLPPAPIPTASGSVPDGTSLAKRASSILWNHTQAGDGSLSSPAAVDTPAFDEESALRAQVTSSPHQQIEAKEEIDRVRLEIAAFKEEFYDKLKSVKKAATHPLWNYTEYQSGGSGGPLMTDPEDYRCQQYGGSSTRDAETPKETTKDKDKSFDNVVKNTSEKFNQQKLIHRQEQLESTVKALLSRLDQAHRDIEKRDQTIKKYHAFYKKAQQQSQQSKMMQMPLHREILGRDQREPPPSPPSSSSSSISPSSSPYSSTPKTSCLSPELTCAVATTLSLPSGPTAEHSASSPTKDPPWTDHSSGKAEQHASLSQSRGGSINLLEKLSPARKNTPATDKETALSVKAAVVEDYHAKTDEDVDRAEATIVLGSMVVSWEKGNGSCGAAKDEGLGSASQTDTTGTTSGTAPTLPMIADGVDNLQRKFKTEFQESSRPAKPSTMGRLTEEERQEEGHRKNTNIKPPPSLNTDAPATINTAQLSPVYSPIRPNSNSRGSKTGIARCKHHSTSTLEILQNGRGMKSAPTSQKVKKGSF